MKIEKILEESDDMGLGIIDFPVCPVNDCEERGRYTICYLQQTINECPEYINYRSQEE